MWDTSCPDWRERLLAGRSLVPDLPLFGEEAARGLRVFRRLRLPDVRGQPTMAEACGEWFFPIVEAVFGSFDPEANRRMIQEFFWLVCKKNSKTTNAAEIMLTATIVNRRPLAEFLFIAPTKEIAGRAFNQAKGAIKADPELDKLFHIATHIKTITHRKSEATLQVKAADADVITGSTATGTLIDETHVFAKRSDAADVFVELRGALAARPDGFLIQITTQSKDPPAGVFKSELAMSRDVRDGLVKLPLLPVLYELPIEVSKNGGWKNERLWPLVNPNLGRSVDLQFLRSRLVAAEKDVDPPAALALLASQHFNVEIGTALRNDGWAGALHWDKVATKVLTLDDLIERCEVIVFGGDGGGLDDLFGLAAIGRETETKRWLLWAHAWAHPEVLLRHQDIAPRLKDFEKDGDLTICEEPTQDITEAADMIVKVKEAGLLPEKNGVGLDPLCISAFVDELDRREINGEQVIGIGQGYRLTGAILGMERKLKDGSLVPSGSPMLSWCVGNAKVERRGNAVLITKQHAGSAKIDPLCAAFDAGMLMSQNPAARGTPEYSVMFV